MIDNIVVVTFMVALVVWRIRLRRERRVKLPKTKEQLDAELISVITPIINNDK